MPIALWHAVTTSRARLCCPANAHNYPRCRLDSAMLPVLYRFFFFQAEDGIRDLTVTGVQTCALPISTASVAHSSAGGSPALRPARTGGTGLGRTAAGRGVGDAGRRGARPLPPLRGPGQIGRASCRERVEISVVAVSLKKKKEEGD